MIGSRFLRTSAPLLVSLAVALPVLGLTSCRSSDVIGRGPVAVVNGHEISRSDVERLVDAQRRQLAERDGKTSAGVLQVGGTGTDTLDTTTFSYALTQLVQDEITAGALRDAGVSTKSFLAKARTDLVDQVQGGQEALDKIDKVLVDAKVRSDALAAALGDVLAKETDPADKAAKVRALYPQVAAASPDCVSVILAADEQGAQAAKKSIDAGVDFAQVAATVSIDQQSAEQGGFLGCTTEDQILQELDVDVTGLSAGSVVGPIEVGGAPEVPGSTEAPTKSYALIRLDSTTGPTFEQARPQLEQQVDAQGSGQAVVAGRQAKLQARAKVQIDPRYGTWDPKSGTVTPPVGPLSTTTTAPLLTGPTP